ncbi:ABC transporter involved in cytochrome c biogenesis, ATPase component CcmA [hydrothermal vent metagenome]|uniref:ABC transporter involved in cytochrome c biogenesis, ATPase component CcmA n=1 Tax=hydrothermal vent metagenome TaxID=652676 RepID=A0A3B0YUQ1_9ZZZZ
MTTRSSVLIDEVSDYHTLSVQNITCFRNEIPLFQPVNFTVKSGEVLLITGPNGSGKTSLLRSLTGLSDLSDNDQWSIKWQDHDIRKEIYDYQRSMAYIGHHGGVKLELTVRENLETTAAIFGKNSKMSINQAIKDIGLENHANNAVQRLSAGQRKRASLCRLLLFQSPLWILDEPQASLDKEGMKLLEHMIEQHLENNGLIVMTTHQQINLPSSRTTNLSLQAS